MTDSVAFRVSDALLNNRPFALFRKPAEPRVSAMFANTDNNSNNNNELAKGFVFAPFASGKEYVLVADECEVFDFPSPDATFNGQTPELTFDPDAKRQFELAVTKAVNAINAGTFDKVVLSRKESVDVKLPVSVIFTRLLSAYPNAFVSIWNHPETGCWIGATPERLLKGKSNSFETMALAGTQAYQGEETVAWARKEQQEQRLVTDYIWNELEPLTQTLELSEPHTHRAGNLLHIKTDISGEKREDVTLGDLAKALHPTPAVCGMPKQKALDFILENEGYDREFYSGYLGERAGDSLDLFVNLRCMKIVGNKAELFMGCGITAGSNPEKEFFETVNKSLTMKKVLG